jgi:hypothetical protein
MSLAAYLLALWHDWQSVPTWIRRLIGGVVVSALVLGGLALWYHRGVTRVYAAGKKDGADSVQVVALKQATAQHDSIVRLNDTLNAKTLASAQHAIADARATAAAIDSFPRAVPLPATIDSSTWSILSVTLAEMMARNDSLLHQVAVPQIRQLADCAERMTAAYLEEHAERVQADSLAHAWDAKALQQREQPPGPKLNRMKQLATRGTWTALVWFVARHVR